MKKISSFAVIGAINTLFSYAIFSIFYYLGMHYLLASCISFLSGTTLSYILNARHTFNKERNFKAGRLFLLSNLFTLSLGLGLLFIFTDFLKIHPMLGQLLVVAIRFPISYLLSLKFVFK